MKVPVIVCTDHPRYRGIRRPRAKCDSCRTIHDLANGRPLYSGEDDSRLLVVLTEVRK